MTIKMTQGDIRKEVRKLKSMDKIIQNKALAAAKVAAESKLKSLVESGFTAGKAPDGKPWAPLKRATKTRPQTATPLTDTGKLRGGFTYDWTGKTLSVTNDVPYGGYHQSGTKNMPSRPMVPNQNGIEWNEKLSRAVLNAVWAAMQNVPKLF